MPSYLDVLAPSRVPDPDGTARRGLPDLETLVRHDLQVLLNAHRPPADLLDGLEELAESSFNFGLRDYTQAEMLTAEHRTGLAEHIRDVILRFEPRLGDLHIEVRPADEGAAARGRNVKTMLHFHITAKLIGPDGAVEATFENHFEWASGKHELTS